MGSRNWNWTEYSLLDVAGELHMSITGASDPLPPDEEAKMIAFLRRRLAEWEPSPWAYDEAVRRLLVVALEEAETQRPVMLGGEVTP